jgi:hypothetical protein
MPQVFYLSHKCSGYAKSSTDPISKATLSNMKVNYIKEGATGLTHHDYLAFNANLTTKSWARDIQE